MSLDINSLQEENRQLKARLEQIEALSQKRQKRKKGALKFAGHVIAGKRLKQSIYNVLDQYKTKRNVTRDALAELLANLIKRLTRIGVVTILFALLPSILLFRQNMLLKTQNSKIQDQTHLAEASRRSAQMFIMGEVLSDINTERKAASTLSNTLVGRIVSLSRSMKPYRYVDGENLIHTPISPERGQLLITLHKSNLNKGFYIDQILQESDFTKAELHYANLNKAVLQDINLKSANLHYANLVLANVSYADLSFATLTHTDFTDANLKGSNLTGANLNYANLRFANLERCNLTNVKLENAKVSRMDWLTYIKDNLKLKGAKTLYDTYKIDSIYAPDLGRKVPTLIKD